MAIPIDVPTVPDISLKSTTGLSSNHFQAVGAARFGRATVGGSVSSSRLSVTTAVNLDTFKPDPVATSAEIDVENDIRW